MKPTKQKSLMHRSFPGQNSSSYPATQIQLMMRDFLKTLNISAENDGLFTGITGIKIMGEKQDLSYLLMQTHQ